MSVSARMMDVGRGRLLAVLGVGFGVGVTFGNVIGAGIFRAPGIVAGHLHTFWPYLAVWIVGAIYALLGANALAELATMMPRSGGQYVFVRRGLGEFPGFITGWSDWLATCGATALVAIVIGEYAVALLPEMRTQQVIALAVVLLFTLIQWIGIRIGGALQVGTSILKAIALVPFAAACFWLGSRSPSAPTVVTTEHEGSLLLAFLLALKVVIYAYDGWATSIYFSGEMRDQPRTLPRALLLSVLAVAATYLLMNLAFLSVVSLPTIAGEPFAAGIVAERLFGPGSHAVLRVTVVLVLLSAVSSNILAAPRVLFAMAKDRLFWRGAGEVNRGGTPDVALLISSLVAAAFVISGTFETVVTKLALFLVANYSLSFLTLFVLRRRANHEPRPWRAWGHPWTTGLALAGSLLFLGSVVASDSRATLLALVMLLVSVPVYLAVRRSRRRTGRAA